MRCAGSRESTGSVDEIGADEGKKTPVEEAVSVAVKTKSSKVDEISPVSFTVVDKVCDDKSYYTEEVSGNKDAEKTEEEELLEATGNENLVKAKGGEMVIEIRPQYCELAMKLTKHVGFRLLCLPWVADTGKHF